MRAERPLDGLKLTLVQPEWIDEPLPRRQSAVAPGTVGLQGCASDGRQFFELAHHIVGNFTIILRLGVMLSRVRHGSEIAEDRRVLHRCRSGKADAVHLVDIGLFTVRVVHNGIALTVNRSAGDGLGAAALVQQGIAQLAGGRNQAITERAGVFFPGGVVTGQLQQCVFVAPANRPVADLCGFVLTIHLNRSHIPRPYTHDIRLRFAPDATSPRGDILPSLPTRSIARPLTPPQRRTQ
ncbi:hypothetical protein D3C81_1029330 [compost metagenome]